MTDHQPRNPTTPPANRAVASPARGDRLAAARARGRIGLQLVAPDDSWRYRPDMDPVGTRGVRAVIVARGRFIEDLVAEQAAAGVTQFVILGAGLDTIAERRPELGDRLRVFEVDQPGTQAWKRRRLLELGVGVPDWLQLVPVDFERGELVGRVVRRRSIPTGRRLWPPPASACTSPRRPPRPRCASSPRSLPARRCR